MERLRVARRARSPNERSSSRNRLHRRKRSLCERLPGARARWRPSTRRNRHRNPLYTSSINVYSIPSTSPFIDVGLPLVPSLAPLERAPGLGDQVYEALRAQLRKGTIAAGRPLQEVQIAQQLGVSRDRKSTRLNSSHVKISYAVFCMKK